MADDEYNTSVNETEDVVFDDGNVYLVKQPDDDGQEDLASLLPDHWVSVHRDLLQDVYNDIQSTCNYTSILDTLHFGEFCMYMDSAIEYPRVNVHDWNRADAEQCVIRYYGKIRPTYKQYVAHFLIEILDLFEYLARSYDADFGCFEAFLELCFQCSSSGNQIPLV